MSATGRAPGCEHVPNYPRGWVVLRYLQLGLGVVIIGLAAYSLSLLNTIGPGLSMFTTIVTLGVSIWLVVAHLRFPKAYNYWAVLAMDLFLWVFWLVSFGLCAVEAVGLFYLAYDYCDNRGDLSYTFGNTYRAYCSSGGIGKTHGAVMAASAVMGSLEFLFFFIAWVTDAVVIHRHRRDGLHCTPVGKPGSAATLNQVQMQPRLKTDYEAAQYHSAQGLGPQHAFSQPDQQSDQQQGYYKPAAAPVAPPPPGGFYETSASPAPTAGYQAPQYAQQPASHGH